MNTLSYISLHYIIVQDRLDSLVSILDSAQVNPAMVGRYEAVVEKLSSRQPIAQVLTSYDD